jgi:hypothetical protein
MAKYCVEFNLTQTFGHSLLDLNEKDYGQITDFSISMELTELSFLINCLENMMKKKKRFFASPLKVHQKLFLKSPPS